MQIVVEELALADYVLVNSSIDERSIGNRWLILGPSSKSALFNLTAKDYSKKKTQKTQTVVSSFEQMHPDARGSVKKKGQKLKRGSQIEPYRLCCSFNS